MTILADTIHDAECESYQADLEALRNANSKLHAEAKHLRTQLSEIERQLTTAAWQRDRLHKDLDAFRELLAGRTQQRDRAERERDAARGMVAQAQAALARMAAEARTWQP